MGFDCGGLDGYPAYCGVIKHPSKVGVINLTHKTPHNGISGITPLLEGARLDHFVAVNPTVSHVNPPADWVLNQAAVFAVNLKGWYTR